MRISDTFDGVYDGVYYIEFKNLFFFRTECYKMVEEDRYGEGEVTENYIRATSAPPPHPHSYIPRTHPCTHL